MVLVVFPYILKNRNNKHSNKKVTDLEATRSLLFYKILNKKCSIKRLTKIDFIDRTLMFQKCNLLVEKDFIIIQGISTVSVFDSIVRNIIFTKDPDNLKKVFSGWEIIKPHEVELNINETQIKIVFKPKTINDSNYSLIISDLQKKEFEKVKEIKNYC